MNLSRSSLLYLTPRFPVLRKGIGRIPLHLLTFISPGVSPMYFAASADVSHSDIDLLHWLWLQFNLCNQKLQPLLHRNAHSAVQSRPTRKPIAPHRRSFSFSAMKTHCFSWSKATPLNPAELPSPSGGGGGDYALVVGGGTRSLGSDSSSQVPCARKSA